MKKFRVRITETALEEIMEIKEHISDKLKLPEMASLIADNIMLTIDSLAVFPKIHRVRKQDSKGRKLRFSFSGSYIIVYWVDDNREEVEVLNVVYERRNIEALIH